MRKSDKSLLCDVVLGFLCPPALIGKISLEAADMMAKERKEREESVPEGNGFCGWMLVVVLAVFVVCNAVLIAKATGQI